MLGSSRIAAQVVASQEVLSSMKLVGGRAEHEVNFKSMVLARVAFMYCLMEEATAFWLHTDNFRRGVGFPLSCSWCPVMNMIKLRRAIRKHCKGDKQCGF
jgi:hypothetical protein